MLAEALAALAAAGGGAIVQAAGSDAWEGLRARVAQLLGREGQSQQAVLERLDRTRTELEQAAGAAGDSGDARAVARQETVWQTRIEDFLDGLDDVEREEAAAQLEALLEWAAAQRAQGGDASGAATVVMNAHARDHGRVFQSAGDMTVHEERR
ncbi:hypothetical protein [Streptomyces geranii]|uniref:hypothetical protein n=1 Tax=Streptomyces geranii TaxID=2058923 RepID=UPI000D039E19|nr:hypothetical protein [Streptomyces geranii]